MNSRYEELFKTNEALFYKNSPILLEAYGLYKDITDGRIICQLKFKNIGENIIKACKVFIDEFEIDGTNLNVRTEYSFLDLHCSNNDVFGAKIPIFLNNNKTRKISIRLNNIVFENYDVVDLKDSLPETVVKQSDYIDYYGEEKAKVFKDEVGDSVKYVPVQTNDYFVCTCGTVNSLKAKFCSNCGLDIGELIDISKDDYLQNELDKRIERERKEKEEKERIEKIKEQKRKAREIKIKKEELERAEREKKDQELATIRSERNKRIAKRIMLILVIVSIITGSGYMLNIYIKKIDRYNTAVNQFSNGQYIESIKNFNEIIGFKDSEDKKNNAINDYLDYLIDIGDFSSFENFIRNESDDNVISIYNSKIDSFIDKNLTQSTIVDKFECIKKIQRKIIEKNPKCIDIINEYLDDSISKKQYSAAINVVKQYSFILNNKEAQELYKKATYKYAEELKNKGQYKEAMEYYSKISYLNSEERALECEYLYVLSNSEKGLDDEIMRCLTHLQSAKYPGANDLYNKLTAWKVSVVANANINDSTTNIPNIIIGNDVVMHVVVSGGVPGESIDLYYNVSGISTEGMKPLGAKRSGEHSYFGWFGSNKANRTGTVNYNVCDKNGKIYAAGTVNIVNSDGSFNDNSNKITIDPNAFGVNAAMFQRGFRGGLLR